jgi:hypothetical protein
MNTAIKQGRAHLEKKLEEGKEGEKHYLTDSVFLPAKFDLPQPALVSD